MAFRPELIRESHRHRLDVEEFVDDGLRKLFNITDYSEPPVEIDLDEVKDEDPERRAELIRVGTGPREPCGGRDLLQSVAVLTAAGTLYLH